MSKIGDTTILKSAREVNGYILIWEPEHHRAMVGGCWDGYVYEHIVQAECTIGRELLDNECVHHLDGDPANNHPSNLLVMDRSQHSKLHQWLRGRGTEPKRRVVRCLVCGKLLTLQQSKYCSAECSNFGSRKVTHPTKEELMADLALMSMVSVGKKYGVSANAVKKWAKSYGIFPESGRWSRKLLSSYVAAPN